MLGLFKRILSRTETPPAPPAPKAAPAKAPLPRPGAGAPSAARQAGSPIRVNVPAPAPARPAPAAPRPAAPVVTPPPGSSTHVQISLTSIAAGLPEAISHKVPAHPEQFVSVPVTTVLAQLGQGHVAMTAAELRECAPEYFSALAGHDEVAITLPLGEIVQQLSPNHFARRSQRRIEVPTNVLPVFASDGQGYSIASQPAPAPTPVYRSQPTVTATSPVPAAAPVAHAAPAPAAAPAAKISMSPQAMAALGGNSAPAAPASAAPNRPVGYTPQQAPAQPKPAPLPRVAPTPTPAPAPAPAPAAKKPLNGAPKLTGELAIPLVAVCGAWVEEVRAQLQDVDVNEHQILAPLELIEPAMKSGKVIFSWAEVAAWIQPPLQIPPTAKVGEMPVELPLKIIAPLFMAHARTGGQKRAAVDETIPDLFGDANGKSNGSLGAQLPTTAPVTEALPAARAVRPAAPAPTNGVAAPRSVAPAAPTAPAPAPAAAVAAPQPKPAAPAAREIAVEAVVGPAEKRFSVKEIIGNTSRLPGVAGALLAMTDGLMVTAQPSSVKGETIAAFLPQMFGRMNQYTKELALGPLEELTLSVESGQWHIIKAPNIYFAVLGKRGETLPLTLLTQIAAELSSQSK